MSFDLSIPAGAATFGARATQPATDDEPAPTPRRTRRSSVPDLPAATVDAAALLRALTTVKPAADPRSPIDALARGVRIIRDEHGRGWAWRTDNHHACRTQLALGAGEPFDALVDHVKLAKATKALGGLIGIEAVPDGSQTGLRLTAGHRTLQLPGLRGEDYPASMPFGDGAVALTAPGADVHDTLSRLAIFAARDETRPILCAVALTGERLVATDSYRLLTMPVPGGQRLKDNEALLIPARTIRCSLRDLKTAEQVTLYATQGGVTIDTGHVQWWTRLTIGQYPNYRQLLAGPDAAEWTIGVQADELADAAHLAVELSEGDDPTVITVGERGKVTITDTGHKDVAYEHELDCELAGRSPHEPVRFGFNPEFLAAAAGILREQVTVHLISPLRPGLLVDEHDAVVLLMPIRLEA